MVLRALLQAMVEEMDVSVLLRRLHTRPGFICFGGVICRARAESIRAICELFLSNVGQIWFGKPYWARKIVPERIIEAIGMSECKYGRMSRASQRRTLWNRNRIPSTWVELVNPFWFFLSVHEKSGRVTFEILQIPRTEKVVIGKWLSQGDWEFMVFSPCRDAHLASFKANVKALQ